MGCRICEWIITLTELLIFVWFYRDDIFSPENIEEGEIEKSRLPFDPVVLEINTRESKGDTSTM